MFISDSLYVHLLLFFLFFFFFKRITIGTRNNEFHAFWLAMLVGATLGSYVLESSTIICAFRLDALLIPGTIFIFFEDG